MANDNKLVNLADLKEAFDNVSITKSQVSDLGTIGTAAAKGVDTSITASSTSTNLPTSQAVAAFVEGKGYKTTDNNTTYSLTQDSSDGHKIILTPSSGTAQTITIPDNNTDTHRPVQVNGTQILGNDTTALNLKAGSNVSITNSSGTVTIAATDTTYSSKAAASGGTDVSLVTTGEKAIWNAKTSNVGTITGITMNGASKGTSGVVDLGTVITSHQDISGKAPLASPALTGTPTAPTAATTTENTQIATTAYVKNKIDSVLAANDAMIFKGTIGSSGATVTALPNTHNAGWTYKVITAATYAGKVCEVGDLIICITDGTTANNDHWIVVQTNVDGAVTGPTSSTGDHIATFNGTSGKVIKDSGYTIAKSVPSNAVFTDTDTKVTAVGNHYTPAEDTSAKLSVDASSSTAATWNSTSLVTGVDIKRDAKGHVVGVAVDSIKMPANPNTDTHRAIQVNGTQALGNNTTALNLKAGSNVTITDGGSGAITIAATDTNTWRPVSDSVSSTSSSDAASSKAVKTAYDLAASKTANTGTVTSVATGTGLKGGTITDSGTISTNVPRVAKDSKSLPGANTWILEEYNSGSNYNLPSNAWYYIFSMQGSDINYGAQLALGMTTSGAYYREYNSKTWGAWKSLIDTNTWRGIQNNLTSDSTTDSLSAAQGKALKALVDSKTSNTGTVTSVATGVGLTGGTITGSGTLKAKLRSETALTIDSAAATTTSGKVYPVAVDKSGYLAVNVPWTDNNTTYSAGTGLSLSGTTFSNSGVIGVKGNSESSYRTGNVNITAANIGLGNVENKSSATIRGELTKANVTTALGYTPPTIGKTSSDAAAGNTVIADPNARTISAGTSSAYSVTNLTSDHVVAAWRFSGGYSENNPPADITVTTANGSYIIAASNLLATGITMQPIFIKP